MKSCKGCLMYEQCVFGCTKNYPADWTTTSWLKVCNDYLSRRRYVITLQPDGVPKIWDTMKGKEVK
jgi:hypothetical protein